MTGATSGIGLALVKQLATEGSSDTSVVNLNDPIPPYRPTGATVILACRNLPRAHQIREQLILSTGNTSIEVEPLDLQSFASISAFAHRITYVAARPIFALVNNAAIFYAPPYLTVDQLDGTFQTNFGGPFLLTLLLLPALRANRTNGARVVNLSSTAHLSVDADAIDFAAFHTPFEDSGANRFLAYQRSKFYLVVFASRLRSLLDNTYVTVHCVDPGNAETAIYRNFPPLANWLLFALQAPIRFFAVNTPPEGAQGVLHALRSCARPFYVQRAVQPSVDYHPRADDPRLADQLWLRTRRLCEQHLLEL